ncbi:MAG: hypothetical protein OXF05_05030 [Hyphomicrobiales bacterium]|nr:hypothetical protein [Hyphomicrobiales bacterium]
MKTMWTTIFAIALMVFAFNATPSYAGDEHGCTHLQKAMGTCHTAQVDEVQDPDQTDGERDVADSGEEGSSSAAGADEQ